MNARKIITLIAVLFIITGTLFMKSNKAENAAVALEGPVDKPILLDLSAAG